MRPVLDIVELFAGYGQAQVLNGVSLSVQPGEIVALVGPNGAGKSTLLNVVSGLVPRQSGTVSFDGRDIAHVPAHELPGLGLVLVPEGGRLFPFMTVQENLELGFYSRRKDPGAVQRLEEILTLFPILGERRNQLAGHLSGGERQMCAIARGVMSRPKLLMLDEPSVGLSPLMVGRVFELVDRLAGKDGLAILLVEQNVEEALAVSSRAYVLEHGHIVKSGAADALRDDPAVRAAYMGIESR